MIMNPVNTKLERQNVGGLKDSNGFAFSSEMMRIVREQGLGMLAYTWPKPGHDAAVDKVS
ncbi:hypothetical protein HKD51_06630 [Pseudomonas fragi]|nr:hypothetical protein [Pseudomonas sp. GC01]